MTGVDAHIEALYHELCSYTLSLRDPGFIHQHVVDAYVAQTATDGSKPIGVAFALVGLYLHVERGQDGRHVQLVHMKLGKRRREWPRFALPAERTATTVREVLAAEPGVARDRAIHAWSAAVWADWNDSHERVREYLRTELGI
jgi:uncharacterized protein DUF5946